MNVGAVIYARVKPGVDRQTATSSADIHPNFSPNPAESSRVSLCIGCGWGNLARIYLTPRGDDELPEM